ncbi:MAG: hypothetical protein HDT32_04980 [Clostridiales bacterium]|nr:hypothetical protein [Clostridiales bacterium]
MKKDSNKKMSIDKLADEEYNRLIGLYKKASVDEIKLQVNDRLIRKTAELYARLEDMQKLPSIIYNKKNPYEQKETAVGKARVKYMAQYLNCMQKLNKELLGEIVEDDDDLNKYNDDDQD